MPEAIHADASVEPTNPPRSQLIYRHPVPVRLWHWATAFAVCGLLFTGFYIFNVHPRLYWGEVGNNYTPAALWFEGHAPARAGAAMPELLHVGGHHVDLTGHAGAVMDLGPDGTYYLVAPMPESWHFGGLRAWHFALAWVLILAWIPHLLYSARKRSRRALLLPRRRELTPATLGRSLWDHLRLKRVGGAAAAEYNPLQKLAYLAVIAVLVPLMLLSGLAMSNAIGAAFPWLVVALGGRESARTLHALGATTFAVFLLVHLFQVFVAGARNEMRSITTGYFRVDPSEGDENGADR